jgi:hypothetical protein
MKDPAPNTNVKLRRPEESHIFSIAVWFMGKGKAIPLLVCWTGPEGSRSLRLPDFKTIGT